MALAAYCHLAYRHKKPVRILLAILLATCAHAQPSVELAEQYVGRRETQGPNRSPDIDKWNAMAGVPMGSPYCASFIGYIHRQVGLPYPNGYAWTPSWFPAKRTVRNPDNGDILGIYFASKQRIGHVGIVADKDYRKGYILTIEANTSPDAALGSAKDREGDGVWKRIRNLYAIQNSKSRFARWNK